MSQNDNPEITATDIQVKRSFLYEKLVRPVLQMQDTPESIALGAAVGMFVALTPTVGIQMPVTIMIGALINRFTRFKMNHLVGILMCWVSNPVTFIPMYYGFLWIGWVMLSRDPSVLLSLSAWQDRMTSYISAKAPTTLDYIKGFFLAGLGELAYPMWLGALVVATVVAIPTYPITLRAVRRYQARKERKT